MGIVRYGNGQMGSASLLAAACLVLACCGGQGLRSNGPGVPRVTAQAYRYAIADDAHDDELIRTFGHKASGSERAAVAWLVERYYAYAAADDGAHACGLLLPAFARALPTDYGGSAGGPVAGQAATCASVLTRLLRGLPGQPIATLAGTRVIGVRVDRVRGFAQLSSPQIPTGVIAVERDRGRWTVASLIGAGCRACYAPG